MRIRPRLRIIVGTSALLLVCVFVYVSIESVVEMQRRATVFFSSALRDANISETVFVGGTYYEVNDGTISSTNKHLSDFGRYRVLRLAYALALARRAPLFGITGVNPQELTAAVQELSAVQGTLADKQQTPRDALLVREALYPTDFLGDLASLERARLAFVASGSDLDATLYDTALDRTVFDGTLDAIRFRYAFEKEASTDQFRFPTLGGTISRTTLLDSTTVTNSRFVEDIQLLFQRERCLSGKTQWCQQAEIDLSPPAESDDVIPPATHISQRTDPGAGHAGDVYITLSESACVGATPQPYVFTYGNPEGISRMPLWYSGDSFFAPTQGAQGTTMKYLHEQLGIDYSLVNPMEFYICPDVLSDIGSAYAVLATVHFAQAHPGYAEAARASLFSGPVFKEPDAVNYTREAAAEITAKKLPESDPAQSDMEDLLNMWNERSAGLDMLVSTMVQVDRQDIGLHAQGVPFTIDARTLFLTHSAFPSLFITQNRSAGTSRLSLRETNADDLAALYSHMIPYAVLVKTVPREKILHDLSAFLSFEGITGQ